MQESKEKIDSTLIKNNGYHDHQPSSPCVGAADTVLGVGDGAAARLYDDG